MLNKILTIPILELLAKVIAFIAIIAMTHILPISEMGTYSLIVTMVMIVSVFMDGGINNKIYSAILQGRKGDLSEYYAQKIIFSFIVIFSIIIYSYFRYSYWIEISLYILMTFFTSQIVLYKTIYRANQIKRMDAVAILIDPISKLLILAPIYLLVKEIALSPLLLFFLIGSIVAYLIVKNISNRHCGHFKFYVPRWDEFSETLREIKFFILFYFLYILFQRIDVLFIEKFLNVNQVAIYFSAYNLYAAIIIFITAIVSSSFPKIKHYSTLDKILYFKRYYWAYFFLLPVGYFIIPTIYPYIYPSEYVSGSKVLFWLLCSIPFVFISYFTIYNLNFLNLESKNIFPILTILVFKLMTFVLFVEKFNNVVVFAKVYIAFEALLSLFFMSIYYLNSKDMHDEENA